MFSCLPPYSGLFQTTDAPEAFHKAAILQDNMFPPLEYKCLVCYRKHACCDKNDRKAGVSVTQYVITWIANPDAKDTKGKLNNSCLNFIRISNLVKLLKSSGKLDRPESTERSAEQSCTYQSSGLTSLPALHLHSHHQSYSHLQTCYNSAAIPLISDNLYITLCVALLFSPAPFLSSYIIIACI